MNKIIMIIAGLCLLIGGVSYTWWYLQAKQEAGSLFTGQQAQTEQAFQEQYPHLAKVTSRMGQNLFTPRDQETAADPAELARKISRTIYLHITIGILMTFAGITITGIGLGRKTQPVTG